MKFSFLIKFSAIAALVYLTMGDMVLPNPYSNQSQALRQNINQYLISLFPAQKLTNFKDNFSTLEKLEEAELGSINSPL